MIRKQPWALLAYTGLRIAIFAVIWLLIVLISPIEGVYAVVLAILVSGVVSIPLLNRLRDGASIGVAGFFRRMNERIDASARAEDEPDDAPAAPPQA